MNRPVRMILLLARVVISLAATSCMHRVNAPSQITASEAPVLVSIDDIIRVRPNTKPHWDLLRISRGKTDDGSSTLVYEYNYRKKAPLDVWTSTTVFSMKSEKQAKDAYLALMDTARAQALESDMRPADTDRVVWGEDSACGPLIRSERPVGDLCGFRKGKRVLVFFASGDSFSASQDIDDLIKPKLASLEFWQP